MSQSADTVLRAKSERLIVIDIFRLVCVCFIVVFHTWAFFIGSNSSKGSPYLFYNLLEQTHAFLFDRAGIWITTISFFLFGFVKSQLPFWKIGLFLVGAMAVQYIGPRDLEFWNLKNYSWGVFTFILSGYSILLFTSKWPQRRRTFAHLFFALLLLVPHSFFRANLDFLQQGFIKQALVGDWLEPDWPTGWFLLPWLGLILLSFEVGTWLRLKNNDFRLWIPWLDIPALLAVISALTTLLLRGPEFFGGSRFNQGVFWVEPPDLAFTVLFPMWIFRLACLQSWQRILAASKTAQWIQNLCWNQHFWFCYLVHLSVLYVLLIKLPESFARHPLVLQLLGPLVLIAVEVYGSSLFRRRKLARLKKT